MNRQATHQQNQGYSKEITPSSIAIAVDGMISAGFE